MNSLVDTSYIQALDSAHFLHPFTDFKELNARGARVMTEAKDIYVWDSEGNRVLDAMSGLWCVNVGYGRRELDRVQAAGRGRARRSPRPGPALPPWCWPRLGPFN